MSDDRKPAAFVRFVVGLEPSPLLRQNSLVDLTELDDDIPDVPSPVLTPEGLRNAMNPSYSSPRQRAPLMVEELPNAFGWLHERMETMEKRLHAFEMKEAVEPKTKKLCHDLFSLKKDHEKLQSDYDTLKDDHDHLAVAVASNEETLTYVKDSNILQRSKLLSQASKDRAVIDTTVADVLILKNDVYDLKDQIGDLMAIKDRLLIEVDMIQDKLKVVTDKLGVSSM